MKILSIAVPCYNSQDYMEKCVDSLLKGGEDVEILIVDDGSKDATAEIADAYEKKYPTIVRAIHQENAGHGGAVVVNIACGLDTRCYRMSGYAPPDGRQPRRQTVSAAYKENAGALLLRIRQHGIYCKSCSAVSRHPVPAEKATGAFRSAQSFS